MNKVEVKLEVRQAQRDSQWGGAEGEESEHLVRCRSLRSIASVMNKLGNHCTLLNKVTYVTLLKEYLWLILRDK